MSSLLPRKTSWTIAALLLLMALSPHLPGLSRLTGLDPRDFGRMLSFPRPAPIAPPAPVPQSDPRPAAMQPKAPGTTDFLDAPPGSLRAFYTALARTERGEPGAITRVLHYGDSPTTADSITSDIRTLLQQRFGDAGHGFLLIAPPWAWYAHHNMKLDARGWRVEPASLHHAPDGIHGLGGVSFRGGPGASSTVHFPAGHTHGVLYYLAQPDAGKVTIATASATLLDLDTSAETKAPGFAEFAIPPDATSLELRVTADQVRLFGYRFDKPGPGVQYSSLGINGAQVQMVVRFFAADQWTAALRHEHPDLVVLNYGTNESIYADYLDHDYPKELRLVIARLRAALPETSILLMSPMDRGVLGPSGEIVTPVALTHLIDIQKEVAAETGCAFFNTFQAMGGAGTMGRWYVAQPRLVSADFMHPFPAGAAEVGALFENALVNGYQREKAASLVSQK